MPEENLDNQDEAADSMSSSQVDSTSSPQAASPLAEPPKEETSAANPPMEEQSKEESPSAANQPSADLQQETHQPDTSTPAAPVMQSIPAASVPLTEPKLENPPVPVAPAVPAAQTPPSQVPAVKSLLQKALEKIQFRKRRKLEKIMLLARQKGRITNEDVREAVRVSGATATRYLGQLVKEGKLKKQGAMLHAYYEPIFQ